MAESLQYDLVVNGQKALAALKGFSKAVETVRAQVQLAFQEIAIAVDDSLDPKQSIDALAALKAAAQRVSGDIDAAFGVAEDAFDTLAQSTKKVDAVVNETSKGFGEMGDAAADAADRIATEIGDAVSGAGTSFDALATGAQKVDEAATTAGAGFEKLSAVAAETAKRAGAEIENTLGAAGSASGELGKDVQQLEKATDTAADGFEDLGDAAAAAAKKAGDEVEDAEQKTITFAQRVKAAGQNLQKSWIAFSAAIAGVTVAVAKGFDEFAAYDQKVREIGTLLDDVTDESLKTMGKEIRELSIEFGTAVTTMGQAKYDAISAGFTSAAASTAILRNAAKLAVGGIAEVSETTELLTKSLNAYGKGAGDATRFTDVFFQTVRLGQTTIPKLAANLGNVASLANSAGLEIEGVGAAMAVLTKRIGTAESVTALRGSLQALTAPTKEVQAEFDKAGITVKRFDDGTLDLVNTISQFRGLPLDAIRKFIPDTEAANGVVILANNVNELAASVTAMGGAAGAADIAFEKMREGVTFQMNQIKARVSDAFITIGEAIAPVFRFVATMVEAFAKLPAPIQQTALAIGGLTVAFRILATTLTAFQISIGPAGWLLLGLGALATALVGVRIASGETISAMDQFRSSLVGLTVDEAKDKLAELQAELKATEEAAQFSRQDIGKDILSSDALPKTAQQNIQVNVDDRAGELLKQQFVESGAAADDLREKIAAVEGVITGLEAVAATTSLTIPAPDINPAVAAQQRLQDFLFQSNQISISEYRDMLQQRVDALAANGQQETELYQQAFLQLQGINGQIIANEQAKQDFLANSGQLSNEQYIAVLQQRLEATRATYGEESLAFLQLQQQISDAQLEGISQQLANDQFLIDSRQITNEQYVEMLEQRLAAVAATAGTESALYRQLFLEIQQVNGEILDNTYTTFDLLKPAIETGWDAITQSFLDANDRSKINFDKVWGDIKRNFIKTQFDMVKSFITGEQAKNAFHKKSLAITVGNYAKEAGAAVASVARVVASALSKAGSYIVEAGANIYKWFAGLPFGTGIPIAAGVIASMVAGFNALKKQVTAFATGGKVDQPTLGLIGEAGETEIIAPESDALTVMREMAGAILSDVRSVMFQRLEVQTQAQAIGLNSQDLMDIKMILQDIRDKELNVISESRIENGDLLSAVRIAETRERATTL